MNLTRKSFLELAALAALAGRMAACGARVYAVPRRVLEAVCDTRTPQGACAAFSLPAPFDAAAAPARLVALDGVQDPGNVGTIWRTADAAGFQGLLLGGARSLETRCGLARSRRDT